MAHSLRETVPLFISEEESEASAEAILVGRFTQQIFDRVDPEGVDLNWGLIHTNVTR